MSLSDFKKKPTEDLNSMLTCRVQKRLSVFLKSHAMTAKVGESTVIRYALERYAREQGWDSSFL